MFRHTIITLSAILFAIVGMAQPPRTVAFYNAENLFDTIPSHTTYDEDMLPLADKRWNSERYKAKLQLISQTLASISDNSPALIGLAEVENRTVLEDLVAMPALAESHYAVCHYDSDDERGIDVALLYRPKVFQLEGSRAIKPTADDSTRDILTAWGEMDGHPTFIVVVHWPSRIGGINFTEPLRRACAKQVRGIVDSVMLSQPSTRIIVMGDMNDNPRDKSLSHDLRATAHPATATDLYNPFAEVWSARRGSSVYDGRWNQYDNIIVSTNTPLRPIDGRKLAAVYSHPSLLNSKGTPRPTYSSSRYEGGASDHLPVYIVIGE